MRRVAKALAVLALMVPILGAADPDPYAGMRTSNGTLVDVPIYDESSKSYFMVMANPPLTDFSQGVRLAQARKFKGVRGRLAIIRSKETQELISNVLSPDIEAWIGLRMYCRPRVLFWIDGTRLNPKNDYTHWGRHWRYREFYQPCLAGLKFAAITLATRGQAGYQEGNGGPRSWYAIAHRHGVDYSVIEFPTGKP